MLKFVFFSRRTHFKDVDLFVAPVLQQALAPRNAIPLWMLSSLAQIFCTAAVLGVDKIRS